MAAYFQYAGPPAAVAVTPKKRTAVKGKEVKWEFAPADIAIRFERPRTSPRDSFEPLVKIDVPLTKREEEELMKIPANLASGEPSWIYTGMVEVDGQKMALLENTSTKLGVYVKQGDAWKKSHLSSVAVESLIFVGEDGVSQTVYRFNPNVAPKNKPLVDSGGRAPGGPGQVPGGGPGGPNGIPGVANPSARFSNPGGGPGGGGGQIVLDGGSTTMSAPVSISRASRGG